MKLAKLAPLVAVAFVASALSGRAYAYLTATGQGVGSAATAVVDAVDSPPILGPSRAAIEPLFPGGRGDLVVSVANPNPFPIAVRSVNAREGTIDNDVGPDCGTLPVVDDHVFEPAVVLAAGQARELTIPDAVFLPADADDACQGANFTVGVIVDVVTVTA